MEPSACEVKDSRLGGKGTYATRNLDSNTLLFRELAFLSSSEARSPVQPPVGVHRQSTRRATPCLSTITVQHKHCPPCARLAPTDTGGSLSGSQDTYDFARAYSRSTAASRQRLLSLAAFGCDGTHAIVEVVQAEVILLRSFDEELRAISASELESAIQRYWANCMGQEGSLYERGSRFNHSCDANCTRVSRDSGGGGSERAFVTLRPVAAGEELTLSYLPSAMEVMGTVIRRRHLWLSRGFLCCCSRCSQPQDGVRQVACPECCRGDDRQQQRNREEEGEEEGGVVGSSRTAATHPAAVGSLSEKGRRSSREQAVFADWWSQSATWVCQSCGWYSEVGGSRDGGADGASLGSLHHREGVLSAEVFALVMASTAARRAGRDETGRSQQADERLARRGALQRLLEMSVALLGRRHWATFSCALMRLQQELSALWGAGPEPPSASPPSPPRVKPEFLDWAMRELSALWQWLKVALDTATSHPPEYYLFDVVCDFLDVTGAGGNLEEVQVLVSRVESWVAVFADEEQRRRFAAACSVSLAGCAFRKGSAS